LYLSTQLEFIVDHKKTPKYEKSNINKTCKINWDAPLQDIDRPLDQGMKDAHLVSQVFWILFLRPCNME
jgi:hypothetical protein